MDTLIALGHSVAPFAIACTVKLSLAALAALLAARILGRRQPARSFAFIVAAFLLGALLLSTRDPSRAPLPPPDPTLQERVHAPRPAAEVDASVSPAAPGLVAKYGSLFQVRFSGHVPVDGPAADRGSTGRGQGWIGAVGLLWLLGLGTVSIHHGLGLLAARRALSRSRPCQDPRLLHILASVRFALDLDDVELRLSSRCRAAFLAGLLRPRIVLPEEALRWPEERVHSTLLHEGMHVKRCDIPVAEGLRLLASLAWVSPLPWLALSAALRLREEACDRAVLQTGVAPAGYATTLLATAHALARAARTSATAAITGRSHLEQRIRAILDGPEGRSHLDGFLRNAGAALTLAVMAGVVPLTAPVYAVPDPEPRSTLPRWTAVADPLAAPPGGGSAQGSFSLSEEGGYAWIRLAVGDRQSEVRLPSVALPRALPLTARARMMLPFGGLVDGHSRRPFVNPGWTIWDDRGVPVRAAASGRVVTARVDPAFGPLVEVDHGSGVRTRYAFGRCGSSAVELGEFVVGGMELGSFGAVSSYDIPSLAFGVLVQTRSGWVALDPAPFLLAAGTSRQSPLGVSVLNASIRIGDRAQTRRLLALGVPLNRASADGTLPLEWTLLTRDLAIAGDLLEAGADPHTPTWDTHQAHIALHGPTVAELARETGDPELVDLLGRE